MNGNSCLQFWCAQAGYQPLRTHWILEHSPLYSCQFFITLQFFGKKSLLPRRLLCWLFLLPPHNSYPCPISPLCLLFCFFLSSSKLVHGDWNTWALEPHMVWPEKYRGKRVECFFSAPSLLWVTFESVSFHWLQLLLGDPFLTPASIRMDNIIFSVFPFRHRGSNCLLLLIVSGVFVEYLNSINTSIRFFSQLY